MEMMMLEEQTVKFLAAFRRAVRRSAGKEVSGSRQAAARGSVQSGRAGRREGVRRVQRRASSCTANRAPRFGARGLPADSFGREPPTKRPGWGAGCGDPQGAPIPASSRGVGLGDQIAIRSYVLGKTL